MHKNVQHTLLVRVFFFVVFVQHFWINHKHSSSCFMEFKRFLFFIRNSLLLEEKICTGGVEILVILLTIYMHILQNIEFVRSERKNEWLKTNRNISFSEIIEYIKTWKKYYLRQHDNVINHPWQLMLIIQLDNYPLVIPCEYVLQWVLKLITIYPSRKHKYLFRI